MGETWAALERSLHRTAKRVLRPRLNQLRQYPPRAVAADNGASATAGDPASLPTFALVTPSYKQGAFIRATIDSVLGQGYPKLRYVVMDGGSADATLDILASYGDRLDWWSGPDLGQADAINNGFERVSGEIMGWVNIDDLLLPGTLAFVARFFRDHPEIDLIYGHRIIIDEQGQEIGRWVLPRHDPAALALQGRGCSPEHREPLVERRTSGSHGAGRGADGQPVGRPDRVFQDEPEINVAHQRAETSMGEAA